MAREPKPHVPDELVEALEKAFPDRLPRADLDDYDLRRSVGHQDVIRLLRHWRDKNAG